jgi:hypothetical protein
MGENENTFFSSLRGTLDRGRCSSGLLTCITSDDVSGRDLPLKRLREPAPGPNPASHRASTGLARPRCSSKSLPILARNLAAACPASGTSNPPVHRQRTLRDEGRHAHGKLKPCPSRNSEGVAVPRRCFSISPRFHYGQVAVPPCEYGLRPTRLATEGVFDHVLHACGRAFSKLISSFVSSNSPVNRAFLSQRVSQTSSSIPCSVST